MTVTSLPPLAAGDPAPLSPAVVGPLSSSQPGGARPPLGPWSRLRACSQLQEAGELDEEASGKDLKRHNVSTYQAEHVSKAG